MGKLWRLREIYCLLKAYGSSYRFWCWIKFISSWEKEKESCCWRWFLTNWKIKNKATLKKSKESGCFSWKSRTIKKEIKKEKILRLRKKSKNKGWIKACTVRIPSKFRWWRLWQYFWWNLRSSINKEKNWKR